MSKYILKTRGFVFYLFSGFIFMFSYFGVTGFVATCLAFINNKEGIFLGVSAGEPGMELFLITIGGIILFGWGIYTFIFYIRANKITLIDSKIIISQMRIPKNNIMRGPKQNIIPRKDVQEFNLSDIEVVEVGTAKSLKNKLKQNKDKYLADKINEEAGRILDLVAGDIVLHLPLRVVVMYTPYFCIKRKNKKTIIVSTKPFSKKGVKKFIIELKQQGIPIALLDVNL